MTDWRGFDAIEINIEINDELVANERFKHTQLVTDEMLEASREHTERHVEMCLQGAVEKIIGTYRDHIEGVDLENGHD